MKYPNFFPFKIWQVVQVFKKKPLYGVKEGGGELQHCQSSTREISHGYSSGRKVDFLRFLIYFGNLLEPIGMTIFRKKFVITLVHFFSQKPFVMSHTGILLAHGPQN
jgi:hypothetical protein